MLKMGGRGVGFARGAKVVARRREIQCMLFFIFFCLFFGGEVMGWYGFCIFLHHIVKIPLCIPMISPDRYCEDRYLARKGENYRIPLFFRLVGLYPEYFPIVATANWKCGQH